MGRKSKVDHLKEEVLAEGRLDHFWKARGDPYPKGLLKITEGKRAGSRGQKKTAAAKKKDPSGRTYPSAVGS